MSERPDRPVFIGNFEYDAEEKDIVRLMEKYGPVEKIDMKQGTKGFAFVYMRYKEDGDEAVRRLDRTEWGYKRRQLRVEWAQKTEADRKRDTRPSKTLFVVNFDARRTSERDIERFFARYGRLLRVQIKKNYSFVQFADVESAVRAMDRCNGAQMDGRTLAVEFVQNEDPNIRVPDFGRDDRIRDSGRDRDRDNDRGNRGRERSRSRSRSRQRRSLERSPPRYERRPSPRRLSPRRASPRRVSPRRVSPPRGRSRSRSPVLERRDRSPSYER